MSAFNERIVAEFRAKRGRGVGSFGDRLLLLTTTGRRTGRAVVAPLAYRRDGDRYVVAASKGGSPEHPQWYENLRADPRVTVEVAGETFRARATALPEGPERDRLYALMGEMMPGFLEYERRTARTIPVVVLERIAEDAPPRM